MLIYWVADDSDTCLHDNQMNYLLFYLGKTLQQSPIQLRIFFACFMVVLLAHDESRRCRHYHYHNKHINHDHDECRQTLEIAED